MNCRLDGHLRRALWYATATLLCVAAAVAQEPLRNTGAPDRADALRDDVRQMMRAARDRVFPALVNIEAITVQYWGGVEQKDSSVGSGTIISQEGHVLTNYHVVENGQEFRCRLADKREIKATLVGEDPLTDLAVLQLDATELQPGEQLPIAQFGDSDELEVGDYVMAMGSPLALSRSVTLGIVSNTERVFASDDDSPSELQFFSGQRTGLFTRWIQHDALIQPGNSGGPLVNLRGELVGVNTRGGSGQGFATPSNQAHNVANLLIEHGEVERSYYGLSLRTIKDTGLDHGVMVNSVVEDDPAHKAGIRAGDVIVKVAGRPVTVRYVEELPPLMKMLAVHPVGETVAIEYERDGKTAVAEVVTKRLKKDVGDENVFRAWGLTAMEITEKIARDRRLDSTRGVIVSSIRPSGPAQLAEPAIDRGDVILAVDSRKIDTLESFIALYRDIMDAEPLPEYLLVEFERSGRNELTLIKPNPEKDEDPPRELPKAWIGVATQPVLQKLAEQLGLEGVRGYRITRVYPHTTAAETDLQVGDIIVKLNEQELHPSGVQDAGLFARLVRQLEIGDNASLSLVRGGVTEQVVVPLERTRLTSKEARRDRNRDFDIIVRELTFFDRDLQRWDEDVKGVLVESVESAGWASRAGLQRGDLIQRINDRSIKGLKSYRSAMDTITDEQPERVVFVVLRGVQTSYLFVEPEWKPIGNEAQAATAADEESE